MVHKVITQIDCPDEWKGTDDFSSHRPLLYLSLKNTSGLILEMGSGFGSTPFIKKYANENERIFSSFETNKEWADRTSSEYVEKYPFVGLEVINMGVDLLFVDCAPAEERKKIIERYADSANVIVVHDTEEGANYVYQLRDILSTFKYRLDYRPVGNPHTTVVSNTVDVSAWV